MIARIAVRPIHNRAYVVCTRVNLWPAPGRAGVAHPTVHLTGLAGHLR